MVVTYSKIEDILKFTRLFEIGPYGVYAYICIKPLWNVFNWKKILAKKTILQTGSWKLLQICASSCRIDQAYYLQNEGNNIYAFGSGLY